MTAATPTKRLTTRLERAMAVIRAGSLREGTVLLQEILADGEHASARNALGVTLTELGEGEAAAEVLAPLAHAEAAGATDWLNYGNALVAAGRLAEARPWLLRAAAAEPAAADVWYSLGRASHLAGALADADACYARATACDATHALAWANRSATAFFLGARDDALTYADRAVALAPTYDGGHFNRAVALLAARRWRDAWAAYEWRWQTPMLAPHHRRWPTPAWNGTPTTGTVLVYAEQGLGDTLQGVRWLAAVRARAERVVLVCQGPLVRWLASLGVADAVLAMDAPLPAHDAHVALWSLPHVLQWQHDAQVYAGSAAYLAAYLAAYRADHRAATPAAAPPNTSPLRVGLAWAGSRTHINDAHRSAPLDALSALFATPGITWVNLQVDQPGALRAAVAAAGGRSRAEEPGATLQDFADTSAWLASCDVVLSVDSAVAHAAAAMGRPTWVLLPAVGLDWRWPQAGHETPWYRDARLWRVPAAGGWAALAETVASALAERARAATATPPYTATAPSADAPRPAREPLPSAAARGAALARAGQWAEAFDVLCDATRLAPHDAASHANLAMAAMRLRRFDVAVSAAQDATAAAPRLPDAWARLSEALILAGREPEAVAPAERAVALAPQDPVMAIAHARALERADHLEASCAAYDAVLAAHPHDAQVRYNRALVLLKAGRWAEGWREYEWRWETPAYAAWRRQWPALPLWDGTPRRGLHLLVRHEQGAGDTIMAARWWPRLSALGLRVTAEVPRGLVPLLAGQWPDISVVPLGTMVQADAIVPALSVPARLGVHVPDAPTAYLQVPERRDDASPALAEALAALTRMPGPRRGLVWAGEPAHPFDHLRSRPLAHFDALRREAGGTWVSLQVGDRRADLAAAPDVVDAGALCRTYADTAAWLAALDALVTVDTSVAHLAGALGRPTLVLLPRCADWRWGISGVTTPWYPTMQLQRASG